MSGSGGGSPYACTSISALKPISRRALRTIGLALAMSTSVRPPPRSAASQASWPMPVESRKPTWARSTTTRSDPSPTASTRAARRSATDVMSRSPTGVTITSPGVRRRLTSMATSVVEPLLDGVTDQLHPVVQLQLVQSVLHVVLHRPVGDEQLLRHRLGGHPLGDQPEHLGLALGEYGRLVLPRAAGRQAPELAQHQARETRREHRLA